MPRVLILEDEPLIAMMLDGWLTELACEPVGPAGSVQAALALIDASRIDGAILDVSVGGHDCFAVADALRDRAVPFVFATGHGSEVIEPRFKDAPTLVKPYDFESLRKVLARLLVRDGPLGSACGGEPDIK
ncbi:MAG TPA: response regulator [Xanthobacteraceae bacterium]|jgi:DNA-binding response OmpR family regulator